VSMTGKIEQVEVITSVERRRRWSAEEKAAIVQETYAPGMSVSLVARRHGIAPNQLFTWRRLYASGALSAVGAGEEVVAASEYRALQHQVRELQRLLGKKTLENEILRARWLWCSQKTGCCARPRRRGTTRREDKRRRARRGAIKPGGADKDGGSPPWASAAARGRAAGRDQAGDRGSANLRLSPGARTGQATSPR
jgi:transposase